MTKWISFLPMPYLAPIIPQIAKARFKAYDDVRKSASSVWRQSSLTIATTMRMSSHPNARTTCFRTKHRRPTVTREIARKIVVTIRMARLRLSSSTISMSMMCRVSWNPSTRGCLRLEKQCRSRDCRRGEVHRLGGVATRLFQPSDQFSSYGVPDL